MFKGAVLAMAVCLCGGLSAQSMVNSIKIGGNIGFALPKENAKMSLGVDLAYQNLVTPYFGLGVATGYTHYIESSHATLDNNPVGLVPAALLLRYYPERSGFYIGADFGYGFLVGDKLVASNASVERPDGGLYLKPEIGYHNRDWNFFMQYQKVFTGSKGEIGDQNYNVGSLGVGVAYNIAIGR